MWKNRLGEAGFSLIELVVAMGLLAVALTAVYQLQGRNLDLHSDARFVTRATQLVRAQLAEVWARTDLDEDEESGRFEERDGAPPAYGWERSVQEVPDREGLFHVRVRVFLENTAGEAVRDVTVETLCYRRTE
ncbi:MAG: prepilin-type N-terminal cleavage/methylation domain-containing protein [Desulfobacteraceae bacterium]